MLNEFQQTKVWEGMLNAETRSLYFGDLASRYALQKQWITGMSFFFSSGAAAAIIGKAPQWVPLLLALISAVATAYAMAVNLDRRIATTDPPNDQKLLGKWQDRVFSMYHLENSIDQA